MTADIKNKGGRPPKPASEVRVHRSQRLLPRHWAKIDMAGKAAFEAYLDAWEPAPEKKKPAK
jgi:hypothetical protein